jgi:hypothetical protein
MIKLLASVLLGLLVAAAAHAQAPLAIAQGGTSDTTGNPVFTTVTASTSLGVSGTATVIEDLTGNILGASGIFGATEFQTSGATGLLMGFAGTNTINAVGANILNFANVTHGNFFQTFDPGSAIADFMLIIPGTSGSNAISLATSGTDTNRSFVIRGAGTGAVQVRHLGGWIGTGSGAPTITSGTATLDATASDVAGTVTEGTTQTGFTLTFFQAFATTPHCTVTSPNGVSLTSYTPSTATLVVANASATADVFTYICVQ